MFNPSYTRAQTAKVKGGSAMGYVERPKELHFELVNSRISQRLTSMDCKVLPIRELLELCLESDDEDAWCEFLERIQKPVASAIIRTLGSKHAEPSIVDDLVHDTWVKLFDSDRKALRRIRNDHENSIFKYAKRAAYHVAVDYLRGLNCPVFISIDDDCFVEPPNSRWREALGHLRGEDVDRCLKTLSGEKTFRRDYAIFWFHFEQGYTLKEISQVNWIGLSESGVESVVLRLVRFVKEEIG